MQPTQQTPHTTTHRPRDLTIGFVIASIVLATVLAVLLWHSHQQDARQEQQHQQQLQDEFCVSQTVVSYDECVRIGSR